MRSGISITISIAIAVILGLTALLGVFVLSTYAVYAMALISVVLGLISFKRYPKLAILSISISSVAVLAIFVLAFLLAMSLDSF